MARILLAEDDESMRKFLTTALERAGYEVTSRNDGLSALAELDRNTHYDLLLTDIVMPGIDGIELAQQAAKKRPEIKVMFITGFAAVSMGRHNPELESASVLSKPFHLNDLVSQINRLLSAAQIT